MIIFVLMVIVRLVQGYFIEGQSYYELKWLLLGEWLNQGFKMYDETYDYTGPIAVFIYKYLFWIFGRTSFIHYGFSSIVIIFQAGIFNQLLLKNKAYDENGYLPAFLYMILMVSVPDFMALSPQLLSLTFILLALRNVLRRIDNQVTDELFLNSGIYIGIATMIYLPSMVFFLVFLFALILFSTAVTRRLLLYLFSFLLAFSLCGLYFYWSGGFWNFVDSYLVQNLLMNTESVLSATDIFVICVGFFLIFILSVFKTWSSARLTNFQQKIQQVIWLMFLGGIATFFLSNEKSLHELVFVIPVIAYFWTHYFILLKRRIFKFLMPLLLVFGLLTFSIYSYSNIYNELKVVHNETQESPTMILGANLSYYTGSKVLTPCFNTHLTNKALKGLDYYNSASNFYQLFLRANPEIIIDEIGIMPKITRRFPKIEETYKVVGQDMYRKINN
ncbi:hypothetical protein [Ekhidna lutea]|uniref:hypothetical protein n=1 Tax=Ekhidna lutea TaxID=447679 RepID=UPI001C883B0E|nr:hypothetical protein [Ekhidna lutea]